MGEELRGGTGMVNADASGGRRGVVRMRNGGGRGGWSGGGGGEGVGRGEEANMSFEDGLMLSSVHRRGGRAWKHERASPRGTASLSEAACDVRRGSRAGGEGLRAGGDKSELSSTPKAARARGSPKSKQSRDARERPRRVSRRTEEEESGAR
jgi:hypothetical protein